MYLLGRFLLPRFVVVPLVVRVANTYSDRSVLLFSFTRFATHEEAVLWKHKLQEWKDFNMDFGKPLLVLQNQHIVCFFTSISRTLLCPISSPGSTYPNGLAAGSINASGGIKNPLASGASNKSSTVSVKSPSPVPSAPSAKDDDYDFDSMQVYQIVNILTFLCKYIREA